MSVGRKPGGRAVNVIWPVFLIAGIVMTRAVPILRRKFRCAPDRQEARR
jgi:hypothetical protein